MHRATIITVLLLILLPPALAVHAGAWDQFGGPGRDFAVTEAPRIAVWGDTGPDAVWRQDLGPGYAGVVADPTARTLFTLTRDGEEEIVVALDAATGSRRWQHRYSAPVSGISGVDMSYGNAPQATPLWHAGRLVTFGFTGRVNAYDAAKGTLLWSHHALKDHGAGMPYFGHAASPLAVTDFDGDGRDAVIVLAGGAVAYDPATGAVIWQNNSFGASYASPILADTAFGRQLVVAGAGEIVGLDPADGSLLWRHAFTNPQRTTLGTPVLIADDLLFVSVYFVGSRGLRLLARDRVEVAWEQPDFQVSHFNVVRRGTTLYSTYRKTLMALDAERGEILWRARRFGAANLLRAGSTTLVLDELGGLTSVRLGREGVEREQTARILETRSWTAPTLIGDRLYARDQQVVVALDLARAAAAGSPTASTGEQPEAPAGFTRAMVTLHHAALGSDRAAIEGAIGAFDAWAEAPGLGTWAAYHQAFGWWRASALASGADRVADVDRAVGAAERAVALDHRNAEAYALLGSLYSSYYQLAPVKARVVGPMGAENRARASDLAPDNPRVKAIRALGMLYTPPAWGGDPEGARALLAEVEAGLPTSLVAPNGAPQPVWGPAIIRGWLASALSTAGPEHATAARGMVDRALAAAPAFAYGQLLRSRLGKADDQESGSSTAFNRSR